MTEPRDAEHQEEPENAAEETRDKRINDPLTRSDVRAPRAPFGSQPSASPNLLDLGSAVSRPDLG
jgi:hypothetical protein